MAFSVSDSVDSHMETGSEIKQYTRVNCDSGVRNETNKIKPTLVVILRVNMGNSTTVNALTNNPTQING